MRARKSGLDEPRETRTVFKSIVELGRWLSGFTYENLTKRDRKTPRGPDTVLDERSALGAGGTCFSVVNLAARRATKMGLEPRFYLGDRPDGEARHCALGFPEQGVFLDPGYHCFQPLPLEPDIERYIVRPHNTLHLEPVDPHHLKVSTSRKGQSTWRYTLETTPVDRAIFEQAWSESFGWDSVMNSRVLTRLRNNKLLLYLNGRLESITRENRQRIEVPSDHSDAEYLSHLFGIDTAYLEDHKLTIDSD
jgi:hypothetical protein